jgi:hypothetical protein
MEQHNWGLDQRCPGTSSGQTGHGGVDDPVVVAIKHRHGIAIYAAGHDGGDFLDHAVSFLL